MASIRRLKKDIDYLTFSVIADCLNYSAITGKNDPQVAEIVQDIVASRNVLRKRVNDLKKVEKKEQKAYCKTIFKDLFVGVDGAFTKLSAVVKKT